MVVIPAVKPVRIPVDPITATALTLLDHIPPDGDADKAIDEPAHTDEVPVIGAGMATTVTGYVT
jgi:hypothetical protein